MTTAATSLLGLALPVTGELSGTWGDTVNNAITSLLDTAVAGTTTLSSDADVTLTTTTLASNQARQAIILWTASGTATRTITAPAQSKVYVVINKTGSTQSIKLVGAGPTSGVTIVAAESAVCAWNGVDFIKLASTSSVSSFSAGSTGLTPSTATSGAVTLAGTLANKHGGTGQASAFTQYGITYASSTTALATTAAGTSTTLLHGNASGAPTFGAVSLTADVTGTLPYNNGGTGSASAFTQWGVPYASTTGVLSTTAAGTTGQYLQANTSGAPTWVTPSAGVTTGKAIAMAMIFGF